MKTFENLKKHPIHPRMDVPTPVDMYIDSLIYDTATGSLCWYRDMNHQNAPAYFFTVGNHRVYLICTWKTPDRDKYRLQMGKSDGTQPALISEEYCLTTHYSALRELWDAVTDNAIDADEMDVWGYIYRYILDAQNRHLTAELSETLQQAGKDLLAVLERYQL